MTDQTRHRLAVIVPYRDREDHLYKFLPHILHYLNVKQIDHRIYVIQQSCGRPFNRGRLLNVGFIEADHECDYFVFHDVDMLPIDVDYSYEENPTHLAASASQFGYQLPYEGYFGGAVLFSRDAFQKVNGFSNEYWGWGAEDDDLLYRCHKAGYQVCRRLPGVFDSLTHPRDILQSDYEKNIDRIRLMQSGTLDWRSEGVNSCKYQVVERTGTIGVSHITTQF